MAGAFLAASARLPLLPAVALALCVTTEYALLQPRACAYLFVNSRGIGDYFRMFSASAVVAAGAAATVLTGVPAPTPPRAAPCPQQACFATMTILHAAATFGPALATSRGRRRAGDPTVWAVAVLSALCAAPLLVGQPPEGGCPPVETPAHPAGYPPADVGVLPMLWDRWERIFRFFCSGSGP